jgi:hypothetical protein
MNTFQEDQDRISSNFCEKGEIVEIIKKTKKVKKVKNILIIEKKTLIIEEEINFVNQVIRKDVLTNMLSNTFLPGNELFDLIMKENGNSGDESRQGWLFETLVPILIILKCIENIIYTEIYDGQLQILKPIKNINSVLNKNINGQGNNIVDVSIKQDSTLMFFSIKYKNKFCETDVSKIDNTITKQNITNAYKIGLIVKDKEVFINHKYKNKLNIDKQIHDKIMEDGLLFDEKDIIQALNVFCQRFSNNVLQTNDFIDFINTEYLLSPRQQLIKKLHQKMTENKFINSFHENKQKMWCIAHKPRSGKSITILSMCKYLLENGINKILMMTSIPSTIPSFIDDLEKYIDFKNINYKVQQDFNEIDADFNGIVICSTEYLKVDKNRKKEYLKKIGFEAIFTDECHLGGSTDKTKTDILDVDNGNHEDNDDINDISKNIKLKIFASGTANKTIKYYGIKHKYVYEWEMVDEAFMKDLMKQDGSDKRDTLEVMTNRHGQEFINCLGSETLNSDYSKQPIQVLMKHSIPDSLVTLIKEYNAKHCVNFGYTLNSLFALSKIKNEKGKYIYEEKFELSKTEDGKDILIWFFDCIISENKMKGKINKQDKTIMTNIEETQFARNSRQSTRMNPLLFIVYLPTHTGNNNIMTLQKTIKQFLEENNLWNDYNIEYSNSVEDTGSVKEKYNEYIKSIMNKTKNDGKRGCMLLLGNKGGVGITYHDCDVTIHLDDGHNLDNQQQRMSRASTEAPGKTIAISVDMNIQRTYLCLIDVIQKYKKNTNTTKNYAEILYYLFEHDMFLFDPQQINNGKLTTLEIKSYYQKEAGNSIIPLIESLLDDLICDDDMRDFIKINFQKSSSQPKLANSSLEGEQQDCPKGGKTKIQVDAPPETTTGVGVIAQIVEVESVVDDKKDEENAAVELLINQTLELCKNCLFYLLAFISRSYKIFDFKEIFINEKTKNLINLLLKDKIELNDSNYSIIVNIMNNIIDNNVEIVNNIREIYSIAPAHKLRELISKHFIPTNDEKNKNAEIPTPVKLVDVMLNTVPVDFWKTPHKVFEPCCGKGNFVLGIVQKFDEGLRDLYPDNEERARIIMTECIYYGDLTALNVFITTELLRCEFESICGINEIDFEFNSNTGDTLKLDITHKWNIDGFDAIVGNPPYQDVNATGDNKLYLEFIKFSLSILKKDMYLLFITPTNIKNYITNKDKNRKYINNLYEIMYLSLNTANKYFTGISTYFAYFLIKNNIVTSCQTKVEFMRNKQIETDEITIFEKQELPLCLSNIDFNIFNKCSNFLNKTHQVFDIKKASYLINNKPTLQRIRDTHIVNGDISKKMEKEYNYPIIDKINKSNPFPGVMYYNKNMMCDYGSSKIIMCTGGYLMPSYDAAGEYNLSDNMIYLLCDTKEKYDGFVILVNSKLIKYMNLITMTDNLHGRDVIIQNIKMINLEEIKNDETIYQIYNLSEEEILLINKTINK